MVFRARAQDKLDPRVHSTRTLVSLTNYVIKQVIVTRHVFFTKLGKPKNDNDIFTILCVFYCNHQVLGVPLHNLPTPLSFG
jgi:hypothetical protein